MRARLVAIAITSLLLGACADDEGIPAGEEGGACLPDHRCRPGLVCASNLCVRLIDGALPDLGVDSWTPPPRVLQLVRDPLAIDLDESFANQVLSSIGDVTVAGPAEAVAAIQSGQHELIYMRTGADPVGYAELGDALLSALEAGVPLMVEHYGSRLLEYINLGTLAVEPWSAGVQSIFFVKADDTHPLFDGVSTWDPPEATDDALHLLSRVATAGTSEAVFFTPAAEASYESLSYFFLLHTPGWTEHQPHTWYCQQHEGLCTVERSVYSSASPGRFRFQGSDILLLTAGAGQALVFHHPTSVGLLRAGGVGNALRARCIRYLTGR